MGDRFCCPVCLSRYNAADRTPLLLECSHTVCKQCIVTGQSGYPRMNTCPIGRCPITKPASALLPNYALLQEVELYGGGGLVDMMEDMGLPSGSQRFVLDASDIQLLEVISTVGATSAVCKGMFEGNEVRRVACHCRGCMQECESADCNAVIPVAFMHACMRIRRLLSRC